MKKQISYFLLFTFYLFLFSCKEKQNSSVPPADTRVEWIKKTWDFGNITQGETVTHTFYFKNTGTQNRLIKNVETGCGCTTADYDKAPVRPGKEGKIEIAFNSEGRYGKQYKEIRIFANIPEKQVTLSFTATVKE